MEQRCVAEATHRAPLFVRGENEDGDQSIASGELSCATKDPLHGPTSGRIGAEYHLDRRDIVHTLALSRYLIGIRQPGSFT